MPDFGSFRGFGEKLAQGQTPTQLGSIGSVSLPNYVLDFYPSSQVAYSLRKLRSLYNGNAIKVRRSSDNTEQDIGYTFFGDLDTSSLLSFCGAGDGFVTTWYDQSGNANNATQSTAGNQPQIVSSGSIILENTKPTISFLSGLSGFGFATFSPTTVEMFLVVKAKADPPSTTNSGFINIGTNSDDSHFPFSDGNIYDGFGTNVRKSVGNPTTPLNQVNLYNVLSASGEWTARLNTTQIFTTASNAVSISATPKIAAKNISFGMSNFISEFIIYPFNQSANRSGIESNINLYYAIY